MAIAIWGRLPLKTKVADGTATKLTAVEVPPDVTLVALAAAAAIAVPLIAAADAAAASAALVALMIT